MEAVQEVQVQDVQVVGRDLEAGPAADAEDAGSLLARSIKGLTAPVEFRQAILDEDRTFRFIVVRFATAFFAPGEEAAQDRAVQELRSRGEAGVEEFVRRYLLDHAEVIRKRWPGLQLEEGAMAKAWAQDATAVLRSEGTAHTLTFTLASGSKVHRMLWAVGDERFAGAFSAELDAALGPDFQAADRLLECTPLHACLAVLGALAALLVAEGAVAWAGGDTPLANPLQWSARLWLLTGSLTEIVFLVVVVSFPLRYCQSPFAREICIVACYSPLGVRTMQLLPGAILVGCCAAALQVHALGAWASPLGLIAALLILLTVLTAVPAFNTLRCQRPDRHAPLVIACLVVLLVLLLVCCLWLHATGHQDAGCFAAYMCALALLLVNVKKYLDYGYSASYELAGYAEWRLLFLLGACLFVLGISNAPPTLLAYVPCGAEEEFCGAWRAALVPVAAALHGAMLSLVP